jgi:hypothetical protein
MYSSYYPILNKRTDITTLPGFVTALAGLITKSTNNGLQLLILKLQLKRLIVTTKPNEFHSRVHFAELS